MKETNTFYTCPYCGTDYSTPVDLAHCILSCEEKKRKEEAEKKKAELALQKENRKKEIEVKEKELRDLITAYCKDYGSFSTTHPFILKDIGWF